MKDETLDRVYRALQISLGTTAVVAGADKFFNLLTDWEQYLNPEISDRLGLSTKQFMSIVGAIEIVAGATVLSGKTRLGGMLMAAWLLGSGNLISTGSFLDVAARDVNIAVAAYALAELAKKREKKLWARLAKAA
ncbi:MAG TPA: hypothetical protein VFP40_06425 [Terriglobales bacterium]|nr:hypothetical protein [Terriglobales bacterium]